MDKDVGTWGQLSKELTSSLQKGIKPPIFFYWLTFIVLLGGVGIWFSIGRQVHSVNEINWITIFQNVTTYSFAILAAAHADINLAERFSSSLKIFSYFILALGLLLAVIVLVSSSKMWSIMLGLIGTLLAYFLWFIANTDSEKFKDTIEASAATGGDPSKDLHGNLEGLDY